MRRVGAEDLLHGMHAYMACHEHASARGKIARSKKRHPPPEAKCYQKLCKFPKIVTCKQKVYRSTVM